jgi:hypothetical protein
VFSYLFERLKFWRTGGGEVPPPAHRLLWFEKMGWHNLKTDYRITPLRQKIISPMMPAKTSATTVATKITLASRSRCHGCRRGNKIFPNKFVIIIFLSFKTVKWLGLAGGGEVPPPA